MGTQSATQIADDVIVDSMISSSANIANNKLAQLTTTNLVANSATTATSSNMVNTIVSRDAFGGFSAGTISAALFGNVTGNVSGSAATFTAALSGHIIGTQSATQIASGVITNDMIATNADIVDSKLARLTSADKVANSATTATRLNIDQSIVLRDLTNGTSLPSVTISGNLTFNSGGGFYRNINMFGGTSTGYIYANYPALGDGIFMSYNCYYPTGGISASIVNNLAGTSMLGLGYDQITMGIGGIGETPITYWTVGSYGNLSASNGATLVANVTGNVSGSAATFTTILSGQVTGTQFATQIADEVIVDSMISSSAQIADSKLAQIVTVGKIANSATTATNLDIVDTIVARDESGNFTAGTITADLIGNVSGSATNFTGSLVGVVTGTQSATTIGVNAITNTMLTTINTPGKVDNAATTATAANIASTIVARDESGNFTADTITADLIGNVSGSAANFTSGLAGVVTGTQSATTIGANAITNTMLATINTPGKIANTATTATSTNSPSTIVARDESGNFTAGTITADIIGNVTGSATSFTGNLAGVVAGTQSETTIGANAITNTMLATINTPGKVDNAATTATATNTTGTIVARDGFGNFTAGTITTNIIGNVTGNVSGSAASFTDSLSGVVTGTQSSTTISANAITNTMLATINTSGKVDNAATTATSMNVINTIVARDESGNFAAETITANLLG
jgi:hypothetical protein